MYSFFRYFKISPKKCPQKDENKNIFVDLSNNRQVFRTVNQWLHVYLVSGANKETWPMFPVGKERTNNHQLSQSNAFLLLSIFPSKSLPTGATCWICRWVFKFWLFISRLNRLNTWSPYYKINSLCLFPFNLLFGKSMISSKVFLNLKIKKVTSNRSTHVTTGRCPASWLVNRRRHALRHALVFPRCQSSDLHSFVNLNLSRHL